jgi:hypothetical protein
MTPVSVRKGINAISKTTSRFGDMLTYHIAKIVSDQLTVVQVVTQS